MTARVGVDGAPLSIRRTGVGRYVAGLISHAARKGAGDVHFTVLLYHPPRGRVPEPPDDLEAAGVDLRWPPFLVSRAISAAVRFGVGVPLGPVIGPQDFMLFTRYWHPPRVRCPSLTFVYDLVFDVAPSTVEPGYLPRLTRAARSAIRRSSIIGLISESVQREIHALYPDTVGRTVVLPPGVTILPSSPPAFAHEVLRALRLAPGYLLHVGTLEPRKNLVRLVRAVQTLPNAVSAGRPLVLVGPGGWDSEVWATIGEAGDRVRHIPFLDDVRLRVLYEHASLLVFPSIYEGFGLPVLEAMALGTPVACSAIPVHHEVAKDAALMFDPADADSIADALNTLLADDEKRRALADAGRARARGFSWEASATGLLDLLPRLHDAGARSR